jgi:hypothetical protein
MRPMYACQTPAFDQRQQFMPKKTDSTPTTPPTFTQLDVAGLCRAKRNALRSAPTTCTHCASAAVRIRASEDCVMAYCQGKTCGKSQILFAPPDLTYPVYRKVCVFVGGDANELPMPSSQRNAANDALRDRIPTAKELEQVVAGMHNAQVLHAVIVASMNENCRSCGKCRREHEENVDANGWAEVERRPVALPKNWPTYVKSSDSWVNA